MDLFKRNIAGYGGVALLTGALMSAAITAFNPTKSAADAIKRNGCELSAIDEPSLAQLPKGGNVGYNATSGQCTYTFLQDGKPQTAHWAP